MTIVEGKEGGKVYECVELRLRHVTTHEGSFGGGGKGPRKAWTAPEGAPEATTPLWRKVQRSHSMTNVEGGVVRSCSEVQGAVASLSWLGKAVGESCLTELKRGEDGKVVTPVEVTPVEGVWAKMGTVDRRPVR